MNTAPRWHECATGAELAEALARAIAADLQSAIATRGRALLAVSGGSTPRAFLTRLGAQEFAWSQVTVTLVDERWVAPSDARSNERLLRETLFTGAAAAAQWLPLYRALPPAAALAQVEVELARSGLPFDAVVLGMGLDGHTASLFPDGDGLAAALDPHGLARVALLHAPSAPEPRITLTLRALASSRHLHLHIEGAAKRALYESPALHHTPLAAVFAATVAPVEIWWAP